MTSPPPAEPRLARGANDVLVDERGREYIDLFSANGTTWLGHANPVVAEAVARQSATLAITGGAASAPLAAAGTALETAAGGGLRFAAQYSTGMEAAEFAIRAARCLTGRSTVIGFAGCMHGKSLATAGLGWPNPFCAEIPGIRRLAFIPERAEETVLDELDGALRARGVAAVFLEPVLASAGGHRPSAQFVRALARLCRDSGTLLVLDEIVTGLYRTGTAFLHHALDVVPDVLLAGKALGNGFPVSAVLMAAGHEVSPAMLPGSTYSGNPVAAAAALAVLGELRRLPVTRMVERIEAGVRAAFDFDGAVLRGLGALWVVELPDADAAAAVVRGARDNGVLVTAVGRHVRMLPAVTIDPENLARACAVLAAEVAGRCGRAHAGG